MNEGKATCIISLPRHCIRKGWAHLFHKLMMTNWIRPKCCQGNGPSGCWAVGILGRRDKGHEVDISPPGRNCVCVCGWKYEWFPKDQRHSSEVHACTRQPLGNHGCQGIVDSYWRLYRLHFKRSWEVIFAMNVRLVCSEGMKIIAHIMSSGLRLVAKRRCVLQRAMLRPSTLLWGTPELIMRLCWCTDGKYEVRWKYKRTHIIIIL